ncbi:hypothetical protein AGLY_013537 [Aphis glycines]|uniref:Uncharacterized protein n=1 Tax=Aphis glycines TaxID=307491 RepID=A0A6G0T8P6_APHGL|nr:hypothetical protein AGLY_013537 [Aphis glycines]
MRELQYRRKYLPNVNVLPQHMVLPWCIIGVTMRASTTVYFNRRRVVCVGALVRPSVDRSFSSHASLFFDDKETQYKQLLGLTEKNSCEGPGICMIYSICILPNYNAVRAIKELCLNRNLVISNTMKKLLLSYPCHLRDKCATKFEVGSYIAINILMKGRDFWKPKKEARVIKSRIIVFPDCPNLFIIVFTNN